MKIGKEFLEYIYSSAPLGADEFKSLGKHRGIFKVNFFESTFRRSLLEEFVDRIGLSKGGVFLLSGYRGVGKTTFLNYVVSERLEPSDPSIICANINLSSIRYDFRLELVYRIVLAIMAYYETHEVQKKLKDIGEYIVAASFKDELEYEISKDSSLGGEVGFNFLGLNTGLSAKKDLLRKQRDNFLFYEVRLQDLLQKLAKQGKRVLFILDELDKIPYFATVERGGNDLEYPSRMLWLFQTLGDAKYLLFESGAIFVLVVNKDVYDYWQYRYSEEDLFMNLVTNVEYLPCYTKEEMRLHNDFDITFADDMAAVSPEKLVAFRECFETCNYYESYANPRLYLQNLSRYVKDEEIRIGHADASYFLTKRKFFALSDLLYQYVFNRREGEKTFSRLFHGAYELSPIFEFINTVASKNKEVDKEPPKFYALFEKYCQTFCNENRKEVVSSESTKKEGEALDARNDVERKAKVVLVSEFWKTDGSAGKETLYRKIDSFLNVLKSKDQRDNYAFINYLVRRLTDFAVILERRNLISIGDIVREMKFRDFEKEDFMGQFLIKFLIPLNILILWKNKAITIDGECLSVNWEDSSAQSFHLGCEEEWQGNFLKALEKYNEFIREEPFCLEAHHRKLRMLEYMFCLGFFDDRVHLRSEWFDSLLKINRYFSLEKAVNPQDKADYVFRREFFFTTILGQSDQESQRYYKVKLDKEAVGKDDYLGLYDEAVRTRPEDNNIMSRHGYALLWQGKNIRALDMFARQERLYYEAATLIRQGNAYSHLDRFDQAWELYMNAWEGSDSWLLKAFLIIRIAEILLKFGEKSDQKRVQFLKEKQKGLTKFCEDLSKKPNNTANKNEINYVTVWMALYVLMWEANPLWPAGMSSNDLKKKIGEMLQKPNRQSFKNNLPKHCPKIANTFKKELADSETVQTAPVKTIEAFLSCNANDKYVFHLYGKRNTGKTERVLRGIKESGWSSVWMSTRKDHANMVVEYVKVLFNKLVNTDIYSRLDNVRSIDVLLAELQKALSNQKYKYVIVIDNAENILSSHLYLQEDDWQRELVGQWIYFLKGLLALNDGEIMLKVIFITNEHIVNLGEGLQEYVQFERHAEKANVGFWVDTQEIKEYLFSSKWAGATCTEATWGQFIKDTILKEDESKHKNQVCFCVDTEGAFRQPLKDASDKYKKQWSILQRFYRRKLLSLGYLHKIVEEIDNKSFLKDAVKEFIKEYYRDCVDSVKKLAQLRSQSQKEVFEATVDVIQRVISFYEKRYLVERSDMRGELVAKSKIYGIDSNGDSIWDKLINYGVVYKINEDEVRLKEDSDQQQGIIQKIAGDKFKEVWGVLQKSRDLVGDYNLQLMRILCMPLGKYMFADVGDLLRRYGYSKILAEMLEGVDRYFTASDSDKAEAGFLIARIKILRGNIVFYAYPENFVVALGHYLKAYEVNKGFKNGECNRSRGNRVEQPCCYMSFLAIYEMMNALYQIYFRRLDGRLPDAEQKRLDGYVESVCKIFGVKIIDSRLRRIAELVHGVLNELAEKSKLVDERKGDSQVCNQHWNNIMCCSDIDYSEKESGNDKRLEVAKLKEQHMMIEEWEAASLVKVIEACNEVTAGILRNHWTVSEQYHQLRLGVMAVVYLYEKNGSKLESGSLGKFIDTARATAMLLCAAVPQSPGGEASWRQANIHELQGDIERLDLYLTEDSSAREKIVAKILQYYHGAMKEYALLNCGYYAIQLGKKIDDIEMYSQKLVNEDFPPFVGGVR